MRDVHQAETGTGVNSLNGQTPTEEQIWRATRHRDISRNVRNFQWKGIHGAHKVGKYFRGMPEPWASYEKCPSCNVTESMEHIILECPDSAQELIWDLAREFLENKMTWEKPDIGLVWGCALAEPRGTFGEKDAGTERAYRIVVSESAFLAWKIRCEKRIEHEVDEDWAPTAAEVKSRCDRCFLQKAHDRLLTNRFRYGRKAYKMDTVLGTWEGLIEGFGALTADIIRQPGVLVGTGTARHVRGIG
ncbi:hypothetical protein AURDEDRAFT_59751 [Auricularia subglabra TFB-10046 SS5]|nr:hypothetical protein AURDEDRAFT_59751 [Auricularia subglabra TFB-10046 SS5]